MQLSLIMVKSDGSSKEFVVPGEGVTIGRDAACRMRIPVPSVSRKHCELKIDDGEVVIADLGSSNGTFVNGKRVKQTELAPGDLLSVGPVVFVIRIDGHPRQIDAKDSYAAGAVVEASDDSDVDMPSPTPPTRHAPPTGPAAAANKPTGPAKPAPSDDDDDDENLSDLLKDFDFGDDDDDAPKKK